MSKVKTWIWRLLPSICFEFVGIMEIIGANYLIGIPFIILGLTYAYIGVNNYKKQKRIWEEIE
ncbi:hypothetical protein [Inconstantimicrobium mannanitabidum]|uniref:Uncharacterized protein n=1 Tax=Inconstantimicrobium mannanitabidum TaxID=1604901 RepID=A0ACB5RA92_9CLOT|nr:hypothetical protein [Clostridium sp. TW13]GKX65944.1 hypothetical protein rsdtw13_12020 [Clostridium sp. TW13]